MATVDLSCKCKMQLSTPCEKYLVIGLHPLRIDSTPLVIVTTISFCLIDWVLSHFSLITCLVRTILLFFICQSLQTIIFLHFNHLTVSDPLWLPRFLILLWNESQELIITAMSTHIPRNTCLQNKSQDACVYACLIIFLQLISLSFDSLVH